MNSELALHEAQRYKSIKRVLLIIFFLNIAVALAKFFYGLFTKSAAMQADGLHSIFDGTGNLVGIIGITLASAPADKSHPYGHNKFESFASALIGVLLVFAGLNVLSNAFEVLVSGRSDTVVNAGSFIVMIGTLVVSIAVTTYERREAKRLSSELLGADALHTLSDILVSLSVIVSLVLVSLGFGLADVFVSMLVAGAIFYSAYEVFKKVNSTLSDAAQIPQKDIKNALKDISGVRDIHAIRSRGSEGHVYADLHILVDPHMTVFIAHEISVEVENKLKAEFPQITDVVVHVEPDNAEQRYSAQSESIS